MKTEKNILIAFILNLSFSIVELIGGIFSGSIAIASDAIHDFGDAISIGASFILEKYSKKQPDETYTFGYARFSVLGGLITTLILLIGSGIVIYNAIYRIINPILIDYNSMLIFACIGFLVNLLATYFTHGGHSLNQQAVNLHMLEDVFGWLVVLIGALVMRFTDCYILDPILSILLAVFIIFNSIKNLKAIFDIFMLKKPKQIDTKTIKQELACLPNVINVRLFHVWQIDEQTTCALVHIVVNEYNNQLKTEVKHKIKQHDIKYVTIEFEDENEKCAQEDCSNLKQVKHCHHKH